MSVYDKPLPRADHFNGEFYGFCRNHELRFQRCDDCGTWRHMPRECCAACGSFDFTWTRSSGRGTVFTWTIVHRALHPGFAPEIPYASVVVELEEGVRFVSNVVDVAPSDLTIGLPVEVEFRDVTPEFTLPLFRRTDRSGGAS